MSELRLLPERRLIMTLALSQALEILQMPQIELAQWLLEKIESNPFLQIKESSSMPAVEKEISSPLSLHEHLLAQIRESFSSKKECSAAIFLLQYLDEKGFFSPPPDFALTPFYLTILEKLQTFHPPGIFARNLQESLLIQLKAKPNPSLSLLFLIENCFDDLLHKRYKAIEKKLGSVNLGQLIQELSRLSLRPASFFHQEAASPIYPDLVMDQEDHTWYVKLSEEEVPPVCIETKYLVVTPHSKEEKEAVRTFKTEARWICRALERRRHLLKEIGEALLKKQISFLDQKGPLAPLSMKELAEELGLHESTLSRALSNKYVATPRGILPLRLFASAETANHQMKQLLVAIIKTENPKAPFTDEELAEKLASQGYPIARRTIAKYRTELNIGPANQRKHLH